MARRKKRSAYSKAVTRISVATGLSYKQIQSVYKGQSVALYRSAKSKYPSRSFAAYKYHRRIEEIQRSYRMPNREIAVEFYRTVDRYAAARLDTNYLSKGESLRGYTFGQLEPDAKLIKTGVNAGKYKVVFDTHTERPINQSSAKRLRRETRAERIALVFMRIKWGKYKRFHKYFRPSDLARIRKRKDKKPTIAEARRASNAIASEWGHKLFVDFEEVFGFYV